MKVVLKWFKRGFVYSFGNYRKITNVSCYQNKTGARYSPRGKAKFRGRPNSPQLTKFYTDFPSFLKHCLKSIWNATPPEPMSLVLTRPLPDPLQTLLKNVWSAKTDSHLDSFLLNYQLNVETTDIASTLTNLTQFRCNIKMKIVSFYVPCLFTNHHTKLLWKK